jgi:hypothetical protein
MSIVMKIRRWCALSRAKKEEKKVLPSQEQIDKEEQDFEKEGSELKTMITREKYIKPRQKLKR